MPELAINGGTPVCEGEMWPKWPVFDDQERTGLLQVFESGKWWWGEKVRQFEAEFAEFQDARFGVSCTTGTAALEMGLIACGVGAGDEVIVPPYTFIATASAVLRANAVPVFADIEDNSDNIDLEDVERKITERTKAVIPVHFTGLPCDMDALTAIAKKHDLSVIEDACHSWGSRWNGKGTGALGDCGAFSFQMSKNITSGEGGILLTDRENIADNARSYSNCGRGKESPWYEHLIPAENLRMTELHAAILLGQLRRLEEQTLRREENGKILNDGFRDIPGISFPVRDDRVTRRAYHLFTFRLDEAVWGVSRDSFIQALKAEGVPCSGGYPFPLYKNPMFRRNGAGPSYCPVSCPFYGGTMDYTAVDCPNAESLCRRAVWLHHNVLLTEAYGAEKIVRAVRKIWDGRHELQNHSIG